jgi:dolichyl-phosphate beta-glucosyltransferase
MKMKNKTISIIIPAYNEEKRISGNLPIISDYIQSLGYPYEIIIVDDGSSDKTKDIATQATGYIPNSLLISYTPNQGKGHAVRTGIMASKGDLVAFTDVDLSAPIDELKKLLDAINDGSDIAIGSRALPASELAVRQPLYRELGGKFLNLIIRTLAVPGIKDTQCGFKLFDGELARKVFSKTILNGWSFDVEALYLYRKLGAKIAEVPIKWSHAEGSKISPISAGFKMIADIIYMRLHKYDLK